MPRVLAFAASLRKASWNKKLVRVAAQGARDAGAEVMVLELEEYPLPVYNADEEAAHGLPANVLKLKQIFREHQAFLIACPEYNGGYPGMFKNLLDWLSRKAPGEERALDIFAYKPVAAMAASPGALGGNRMMATLRGLLLHLQMLVIPEVYGLGKAAEAFDEHGNLKDPKADAAVKKLGQKVTELAATLAKPQ